MKLRSLQTRFLLAGAVLLLVAVACGIWSALASARLVGTTQQAIQRSQDAIELAANVGSILERENDALLIALSGDQEQGRLQLETQRRRFDDASGPPPAMPTRPRR